MNKKCENCIWRDQCAQENVCEYYEEDSETFEEEVLVAEYQADIDFRHELYIKQVEEQNS